MVYRSRLRLIDFQGMRYGPPAYDLASFLVDPYVAIPRSLQEGLVELYWSRTREFQGCSHRRFRESYSAVRLCRNLQALGAYGYLGLFKGKKQFLRYIPRAWQRLHHWINGPCKGKYPTLEKWVNRIQDARPRGAMLLT
jgi:aminoglycoside/choline kinase family phosphotransferase